MIIQFAGYDIEANSRIYNFDVMDPPREAREFTVEIESKTSRWGSLKLQDGPGICFERLRRELERETFELCATSRLRISERAFPLNLLHTQVFPAAEKPVTSFRT